MNFKEIFLQAIVNMLKVKITFNSKEKGQITRVCIPFDLGISQKVNAIDKSERYHLWDLSSSNGSHNLALKIDEITNIEILDEKFDPIEYVTWQPNWIYKRNWGTKS